MIENALGFSVTQRDDAVVATNHTQETSMTTNRIPATQNEAWGFTGTLNEQAETAWPIAMTAISDATSQPLESVRACLESRHGRHFADDVLNQLHAGLALADAIHAATQKWMGWTVCRATHKEYGIPIGLPLLTGFVIHCEIAEEALST